MLFEFIDTAYSCTILILIIAVFFIRKANKKYVNSLIATANTMLIFYSWYLSYQFYKLIQFVLSLKIQIPNDLKEQPVEISWFHIKFVLLIILPYFFLIKKIADSKILALIMLVLLQWDIVQDLYFNFIKTQTTSGVLFYMPYMVLYKILSFVSLFIAVYALLWLIKKLPHQQEK